MSFSVPGAKQQRYNLPIIPAAALLVGQLWRYYQALSERGDFDPGVNTLRVPHWGILIAVSLGFAPFFIYQRAMLEAGWFDQMPVGELSTSVVVLSAVVLTFFAALGTYWHYRWRPMRAMVVTALWSAVLLTVTWYAWSTGERGVHPIRESAQRMGEVAQGAAVGVLNSEVYPVDPNEEFLFYTRRIYTVVDPSEVQAFGRRAPSVMVAVPPVDELAGLMQNAGYEKMGVVEYDYDETFDLWRFKSSASMSTD